MADALAAEAPEDQREQVRRKALRAPLRAFLVFTPRLGHKVPEWEQLAAGSSVTHALMLLLHARGYGSIWRTGRLCSSMAVGELLGVAEGERLLGAVDIGTPARTAPPTRRPLPEISAHLSVLTPAEPGGPGPPTRHRLPAGAAVIDPIQEAVMSEQSSGVQGPRDSEELEDRPIAQRKNGLTPAVSDELGENMRQGWADTERHGLAPIPQAAHTARRRAALSARFPGELLVVPAGNPIVRANDTHYPFRPSSDYLYLTGDQTEDGVLVLEPEEDGGHRAVAYLRPRSDRDNGEFWLDGHGELWDGRRNSLTENERLLGLPAGTSARWRAACARPPARSACCARSTPASRPRCGTG